ncbi:hypothetical protein Ga0100230_021375 [Opitutaceae bacterium TAV3]|nr:hypothetical protein Ga0100230_021375 [Opitutaceae bacterium TAV3]
MLDIRRSPPPPPLPAVEVPSLYVTAPGRFEIVALDPRAGNAAIQWGTLAWETLRRPLALPEAYPDAIRVRLIPAAQWSAAPSDPDTAPSPDIQTTAEANGFVSVRIRLPDTTAGTGATGKEDDDLDLVIRRGLVQGLLLRQAIAWHGAAVHARLPRWLEYAGAQLMLERAIPAMYDDAWRQQATALPAAPPLAALLHWRPAPTNDETALIIASRPLMLWLEAGTSTAQRTRWQEFLRRILSGADPLSILRPSTADSGPTTSPPPPPPPRPLERRPRPRPRTRLASRL